MIRVVICDSHETFATQIADIVNAWRNQTCIDVEVSRFSSSEDLLESVQKGESYDLIFLETDFPDELSGFEVVRQIRASDEWVSLILISEKEDIPDPDYLSCVLRYLRNPFSSSQIMDCLELVRKRCALYREDMIPLQDNALKRMIPSCKIGAIEVQGHHLIVHSPDDAELLRIRGALSDLMLPEQFVRCHRSYIVNLTHLQTFSRKEILLRSGMRIPVSATYHKHTESRFSALIQFSMPRTASDRAYFSCTVYNFGHAIRFVTDCAEAYRYILCITDSAYARVNYRVTEGSEEAVSWELRYHHTEATPSLTLKHSTLSYLSNWEVRGKKQLKSILNWFFMYTMQQEGHFLLFASAVSTPRGALILFDHGRGGRTRLMLELCKKYGWKMITNSCLLLSCVGDCLTVLKGSPYLNLQRKFLIPHDQIKIRESLSWMDKAFFLPEDIGITCENAQVPLRAVLFVNLTDEKEKTIISPLPRFVNGNSKEINLILLWDAFSGHVLGSMNPLRGQGLGVDDTLFIPHDLTQTAEQFCAKAINTLIERKMVYALHGCFEESSTVILRHLITKDLYNL